MRWQATGSRTLAQQPDVAQRWFVVDVLAPSDVSDGLERPAGSVFGLDRHVAITPSGYSFGRVQTDQIAPGYAIEHAPDLGIRIEAQIRRRRLPLGPAFQVEAEPIPLDPTGPALERPDTPSDAKRGLMHVGAVSEIPDLIAWPA